MFFDDQELSKVKRVQLAELPPTLETGWRPPRDYPNFQQAIAIGFDFEVKENEFERGPGWSRGKSSICGGSIDLLFRDGTTYTEYRPIRHEVDAQLNLDSVQTIRYWRDVLQTSIPKFGANLIYDIGNATDEEIWVQGELYDCQYAEALLTQDDLVNLEFVSHKYLKQHKQTSLLYEWCAKAYGGEPTAKQRTNIYRTSPKLAGPYGEQDAHLPRLNLIEQAKLLQQQGLWDLFRMECDLIPLWVLMRKFGCRVDLDQAVIMKDQLTKEIKIKERAIYDLTGKWINVLAPTDLAPAYNALNVKYPLTAKTQQPSFRADWFRDQTDPLSELVLETRQFYKLRDTFIESYILKSHVNERIHGQFHPLRNEGSRNEQGGTVTGRLSSSTPDLQNIPSRTTLGREVMKMFLPDEGHACVESGDGSQIEYRCFMHFAIGPKSDEFRQKYINDPKTDYHTLAQTAIKDATGIYIPRSAEEVATGNFKTGRLTIKEVNFGKLFGVGPRKTAAMAHCELIEATKVLDALGVALPFIKPSQKAFIDEAKALGYITTVLNRRYRFDLWEEVSEWNEETQSYSRSIPLPYEHAIREYGQVQRAGTHKAMAGRCQGSAADWLKYSLWRCLKDGVFAVIGYPKLTVHDQMLRSVIDLSPQQEEAGRYYHWLMEHALAMRVPVLFKLKRGPNWGSA
jgi:DNA polymerase I-like protein with 3'-5' exonuclease and polymerase domains